MDEVVLRSAGRLRYLWRVLEQDYAVLDMLPKPRREKRSAKRFLRNLMNRKRIPIGRLLR